MQDISGVVFPIICVRSSINLKVCSRVSLLTHSAKSLGIYNGRVSVTDSFPAPNLLDIVLRGMRAGSEQMIDDRLPDLSNSM